MLETARLGEAMLRSSQPLLPFLTSSIHQNPKNRRTAAVAVSSITRQCPTYRIQYQNARSFSTSRYRRQEDQPSKVPDSSQFPSISPSSKNTVGNDMGSMLDRALDHTKGAPGISSSRTSRFSSPNAQARNTLSTGAKNNPDFDRPPQRSSVDDLFASMSLTGQGRKRGPSSSSIDIASMIDPKGMTAPRLAPSTTNEELPIRLGPTAGRSVTVDPQRNMDLGRAFQTLDAILNRNSVKSDFYKQRFHERPGMKRKRLKSLRWRKRFKAGFKAVLVKVQKMKKQGW